MIYLTNWIKYELYPSLFEKIDKALPEFEFKRQEGGWISKTCLDDSIQDDYFDKTVVLQRTPGLISEKEGRSVTLIDYVMIRDKAEFKSAITILAKAVGIQIPTDIFFDLKKYIQTKDEAFAMDEINKYFIYCLQFAKGNEDVLKYLNYRGYSLTDIESMELGYVPTEDRIAAYLSKKNYKPEVSRMAYKILIEWMMVIKQDNRIGSSHKLVIPFRTGGVIKGFKFRTIGNDIPKYINSRNLDNKSSFFNIQGVKGNKELIIVEGEFDALHAQVRGLANVVATSGDLNMEQIRDAKRRGVESVTLCLSAEFEMDILKDKLYRDTTTEEHRPKNFVMITRLTELCVEKI